MKKKSNITIHDIAKILKISPSTVSRALNDSNRISDVTKRKVKELAKKLNYQPNIIATHLRTGKSKTIGVIVPHINRNFFSNVIGGIEVTASSSGYKVIIAQSKETLKKEIESINAFINARVDGILVSISIETNTVEHFKLVKKHGIPILFFDRAPDNFEASKVIINDFMGAYKAVKHLIESGYKKISHFAGPQQLSIYRNRLAGYLQALKDSNIEIDEDIIYYDTIIFEKGYKVCEQIINSNKKVEAIFSASDISALGAIQCIKQKGYKIPDNIAIVGFANEPFDEILEPRLTSVEQHSYEIGQKVTELLIEEITTPQHQRKYKTIVIEPELIIRESSMRKIFHI